MTPKKTLNKYFGFSGFREGQEEIINSIMDGKNVLAVLPTGAGKSLCYQIPALMEDTFSIVISPLIALMKDQVDSLNQEQEIAACINSSVNYYEFERIFQKIQSGTIKLLYVAPERLQKINFAKRIKELNPAHIFIDEAHCISEWGHNFRPSYKYIKDFCDFLGNNKVSAFTATATPFVRKDIVSQLGIEEPKIFVKGFERKNLFLNVISEKNKKEKCFELIEKHDVPAIIYSSTRKNAEQLTDFLKLKRVNCEYYHAGLAPNLRKMIQEDFLGGQIDVIIATNAFGMGIDKENIRLIIHYNMPGSIENYYQEIGRAGRDNKQSHIFLLFSERDIYIQKYFITNSYPTKDQILDIYSLVCDYGNIALGNKYEQFIKLDDNFLKILESRNISRAMLSIGLNILSSHNYLITKNEFDQSYKIKYLTDIKSLKNYVKSMKNNSLQKLLVTLLREYGNTPFMHFTKINIYSLAKNLEIKEEQIHESLNLLCEVGIIELDKPLDGSAVKINGTRLMKEDLMIDTEQLGRYFQFAEYKLQSMIEYGYTEKCRFNYILNYFGDENNDYNCGRCDNCSDTNSELLNETKYLEEIVLDFVKGNSFKLTQNEIISYLKGNDENLILQSPDFGTLSNYDKEQIKTTIKDLINKDKFDEKENKIGIKKAKKKPAAKSDYKTRMAIFNELEKIRFMVSKKFGQSPDLICTDNMLKEISEQVPLKESELYQVKGFSKRNFNKFGKEILSVTTRIGRK